MSAVAWFGYFYAIYGTMSPSAPHGTDTQTAIANLPRGVPGLLFDQQFGLIANAPVYGFVIAGLIVFAMRLRRWSWDLLMVSVPTLALRVGWASPPVQIWNLHELSTNPVAPTVRFPVAVGSVLIEGDEHARRAIQGIELEPSFDRRAARPLAGGTAVRAAKYGPAIVYFMDDGAFAEPEGFWVVGREQARVAIVNDQVPLRLFLRNAPVENVVDIETAGRTRTIAFGPGEETTIELPETQAATRAVVVRIRTSRGFRPFDRDHTNLDMRYLGCWVEIR